MTSKIKKSIQNFIFSPLFGQTFLHLLIKTISSGTSYVIFMSFIKKSNNLETNQWAMIQPLYLFMTSLSIFSFDSIYSVNFFKNKSKYDSFIYFFQPLLHFIILTFFILVLPLKFNFQIKLLFILIVFFNIINQFFYNYYRVRIKLYNLLILAILSSISSLIFFFLIKLDSFLLKVILSVFISFFTPVVFSLIFKFNIKLVKESFNYIFESLFLLKNYYSNAYPLVIFTVVSSSATYVDRYILSDMKHVSYVNDNMYYLSIFQMFGLIIYSFFQAFVPHIFSKLNTLKTVFDQYLYVRKFILFSLVITISISIFVSQITFHFTKIFYSEKISLDYRLIILYSFGFFMSQFSSLLLLFFNYYEKNRMFISSYFVTLLFQILILFYLVKSNLPYPVQVAVIISQLILVILLIRSLYKNIFKLNISL